MRLILSYSAEEVGKIHLRRASLLRIASCLASSAARTPGGSSSEPPPRLLLQQTEQKSGKLLELGTIFKIKMKNIFLHLGPCINCTRYRYTRREKVPLYRKHHCWALTRSRIFSHNLFTEKPKKRFQQEFTKF